MRLINRKYPYIVSNNDLFQMAEDRVKSGNSGATVFIPHVCNNIDLFGSGFAEQVATKYPSVKEDYHLLGKNFLKANFVYSQIIKVYEDKKYKHKMYIVNMIAQNGTRNNNNPRPLNYLALAKCMVGLSQSIQNNSEFADKEEKVEIHAPKFGSGLAGGNWNFISDLIEDIWAKHIVYVYNYPVLKAKHD